MGLKSENESNRETGREEEGRGRRRKKRKKDIKTETSSAGRMRTRPEDSVPVNSPVLHKNTSSHYYYFLHHVSWPVSYRHGGWQQNHCRPITNSLTVISNSCFRIINIILTYFNDALNSSCVKQCTLSVWGCEHSVAHKNNLTTPETNPFSRMGGWYQWPTLHHRNTAPLTSPKVFKAYSLVKRRVESSLL